MKGSNNKMKKQKVIRTYPKGWNHTIDILQNAMDEGYCVVMCNKIIFKDKEEVLEYIVERRKNKCQYMMT